MNKHIELVKKWLANPKSVTKEELEANADAAAYATDADHADAVYVAAYAAYSCAYSCAAAAAAVDAAHAAAWVKRYEGLTNER